MCLDDVSLRRRAARERPTVAGDGGVASENRVWADRADCLHVVAIQGGDLSPEPFALMAQQYGAESVCGPNNLSVLVVVIVVFIPTRIISCILSMYP